MWDEELLDASAVGVAVEQLLLTPGKLAVEWCLVELERLIRRVVCELAIAEGNGWLENRTGEATGFLEETRGGLFEPEQRAVLGP